MRKLILNLFRYAAVLIGAISCTDEIEIDLPKSEQKLVVQAWFKNDSTNQHVILAKSTNYSDQGSANLPETEAVVRVLCSDGSEYLFVEESPGDYSLDKSIFGIEIGKTYTLNIKTKEGKFYSSTDQLVNDVPPIDGHIFINQDVLNTFGFGSFFNKGYYASITYKELLGKGDNYVWKLYQNGTDLSVGNSLIYNNDNFLVDGARVPYEVAWFTDTLQIGDTIKIEQMTTSTDVYKFFFGLQQQSNGGGPFSTPPAPVEGNMYNVNDENELVLGTFIVSATSIVKDIITEENTYESLTPELNQILSEARQ